LPLASIGASAVRITAAATALTPSAACAYGMDIYLRCARLKIMQT
jgi:hypothetical protein